MRFGKTLLAAVAALAIVGSPVAANAASAKSKPSAEKVKRVGAEKKAESKLGGENGVLIAAAVAAAVILGIVVLTDDDEPSSP